MSFAAFFERARAEAARYGPDPWVFVRELWEAIKERMTPVRVGAAPPPTKRPKLTPGEKNVWPACHRACTHHA